MANTKWEVIDYNDDVLDSGETDSTSGVINYTIPDNYEGMITFKIYDSNNENCSYTIKKTVECCKIISIVSIYASYNPAPSTGTSGDNEELVPFTATCNSITAFTDADWIDNLRIPYTGVGMVLGRLKPNTTETQRSGVIKLKNTRTGEVLGEVSVYQKAKEACPNPNPPTVLFNIDDDIGSASFVDFTSDVWVVTSTTVSSNISDYVSANVWSPGKRVRVMYGDRPPSTEAITGTITVALTDGYGETVEKTINVEID